MDPALLQLIEGDPSDEIEAIIKLKNPLAIPTRVQAVAKFGPIITCRVERRYIRDVWGHPDVLSFKATRLLVLEQEIIDPEAVLNVEVKETDQRRPSGIGVTGRGVIVGFVDVGCDFAHPNLRHADGSTRLLALWDQSSASSRQKPEPYDYGVVYSREEINQALLNPDPYGALGYHPAKADPGGVGAHGTLVMDIAAGNGRVPGSPPGIAPEADLVFVHVSAGSLGGEANLGDSVRILEALDFINKTAGGRPYVVNISLGRRAGGHDGLSLVEQGMDALLLEAPGRAIVLSTGNYLASEAHASGELRPGQRRNLTWLIDQADITPNELEIWYSGKDSFVVELESPDGNHSFRAALGEDCSITIGRQAVGHLYHRFRDPNNGDHHVDIFLKPPAPGGSWRVTLIGEDVVNGKFHAWVERDVPCPRCDSRFDPKDVDPTGTTGTICNGFRTIAVGAYNPHSPTREIADFSSCGPTRDFRQKPDLVAPGVRIIGARSASKIERPHSPLLTRMSGTSFAAPQVTGTIALMFEVAGKPLPMQETRRLLLSSTQPLRGDFDLVCVGSGFLDVEMAVNSVLKVRSHVLTAGFPDQEESSAGKMEMQKSEKPEAARGGTEILSSSEAGSAINSYSRPSFCSIDFHAVGETPPSEENMDDKMKSYHSEEKCEYPLTDLEAVDEAIAEGRVRQPGDLLAIMAESTGGSRVPTSAATLFDALTVSYVSSDIASEFEIVAQSGDKVTHGLVRTGDILLRRAIGEPNLAHAAVLATGELFEARYIPAAGWQTEHSASGVGQGLYAQVIEGGPFPHRIKDAFARRLTDASGRLSRNNLIIRPKTSFRESTEDRPKRRGVQRIDFEPITITVPVANIGGRGESAGEREVDEEVNKLRGLAAIYWDNYHAGLNNFDTAMSFASDQETQPRYFEVTLKEVGKLLLDQALKNSLKGHPILGVIADGIKSVVTAWYEEAERASRAQGDRRIADYIADLRHQAGSSDGPQQRMLSEISTARPRLLVEYRDAVTRSRVEKQGERGVLTGDAAIFIHQLRQGVEQFRKTIPSPALFAQHFAERFGSSQAWTGLVSHGGRPGGMIYLEVSLYLEEKSGRQEWSLRSVESAWTLATTAPKPDRLATALKTALHQQGKKIWQTNLPKMVQLNVEKEIPWALNKYYEGFVRVTNDPKNFEIRSNYGPALFRQAWQVPAIQRRVLAADDLRGSNR